jgi:hypothetical protein
MDADAQSTSAQPWRESPQWQQAYFRQQAQTCGFWWQSPRAVARQLGRSDSSLRYCLRRHRQRCQDSRWPHSVVHFLDSPDGIDFLHHLHVALHLVFGQANDCGLRALSWFLKLSGLDEFLPASHGALQAFAANLETLLAEYGQQQEQQLAAEMPPREITLCEDETFHPQICLVAIEPVSDYLLLEQYASARDADTWNQALDQRLAGLSVTVTQVASDEAAALIAHAEQHLGAHHSPDLFHVQQETVKATSLALAGQTRRAHQAVTKAEQATAKLRAEQAACLQQCPQSTQVAELQQQLEQTTASEAEARRKLAACQQRQQQATESRRGLSHDYHPLDLETGEPLETEEVARRLSGHFDRLQEIAAEAGLSDSARARLAKARRVLDAMIATIAFFWTAVARRLASRDLSAEVSTWLREQLLAGFYLKMAAAKARTAAERERLRARAEEVLARARSPDGVWGRLSVAEQGELEGLAGECAGLFQRSSSCVEGRNGQLSLKHHALHRLTQRKLAALGVLHNFLVQRADGTTAAERFFGQRPQPLYQWLICRLPFPGRPWQKKYGG